MGDQDIAKLETMVREGDISPGAAADNVIHMMLANIQASRRP